MEGMPAGVTKRIPAPRYMVHLVTFQTCVMRAVHRHISPLGTPTD